MGWQVKSEWERYNYFSFIFMWYIKYRKNCFREDKSFFFQISKTASHVEKCRSDNCQKKIFKEALPESAVFLPSMWKPCFIQQHLSQSLVCSWIDSYPPLRYVVFILLLLGQWLMQTLSYRPLMFIYHMV